ncbi:MAG: hypothetical protein WAQ88_00145, partial [Caldicoprobacterales bacterium]
SVEVGESEAGDTITMSDIKLDSRITAITPLDEVLAVVTLPRIEVDEDIDESGDAGADTPDEE